MTFSLATAGGLVCLPGVSFALGQLYLLVGGRLSAAPAIVLLLLTVALSLGASWRLSRGWAAPAAVAGVALVAALACSFLFDTSYDGQQYHFDGIAALAQGWNPYRDGAPVPDHVALVGSLAPWSAHYSQGAWISAAVQLAAGVPLEATKSHALLMLAALVFAVFGVAREFGVSKLKAGVLAVIAAGNPILIVQIFTRMNDGLLGASLALMLLFSIPWVLRGQRWALIGVVAPLVFALNLKFSGVPMAVFFCAVVCGLALWRRGWRQAAEVAGALAAAGVIGVVLLGAHPYVTNTISHGHPFYPLMGDTPVDIIGTNLPPALEKIGPVERIGASYFGSTASGYDAPDAQLKLPLMTKPSEIINAGAYDTRVAGFGPFFSAALVLALGLAAALLVLRGRSVATRVLLAGAGAFVVLGLIMPEAWWARYVPQVWWAPVLVAAAAFVSSGQKLRIVGWVLAGVMALNAALVGVSSAKYVLERNLDVRSQFAEMQAAPQKLCLHVGELHARLALLGSLKDKVRVESQPLQGCTVTPLAGGFPHVPAGYCACP